MQTVFRYQPLFAPAEIYNSAMSRNNKKLTARQGQRLAELRKKAGLSQYELARLLGVPQSNIAFWEHSDKPPRSELLPRMAEILGVKLEDLIYIEGKATRRVSGPIGKMRQVFEQVSRLPRSQQEKIVEFVSVFVKQYEQSNRNSANE